MKQGNRLAAYKRGKSGETIVFLHGFLASARYWRWPQWYLRKTHRTIALDLLGFGQSPKPINSTYGYKEHLQAIEATLDHQTISEPFILVGHSMGALLALRYAVENPDKVSQLHLFNPPLFLDQQQAHSQLAATSWLYQLILYSRWRRWFWRCVKLFPVYLIPAGKGKRGHFGVMRHTYISRERSLINVIENQQSFKDLKRLTVPTTLIVSRYDRYAYQQNLALHDLPPNITVVFKESDHHFPVRDPKGAVQIITK